MHKLVYNLFWFRLALIECIFLTNPTHFLLTTALSGTFRYFQILSATFRHLLDPSRGNCDFYYLAGGFFFFFFHTDLFYFCLPLSFFFFFATYSIKVMMHVFYVFLCLFNALATIYCQTL